MAVLALVRYQVRPDAVAEVERALHDHASFVRATLPRTVWTVYREAERPAAFAVLVRSEDAAADARWRSSDGARALAAALAPALVAPVEDITCELVTSSDLAPRHRTPPRPGRRPRR